MSLQVFEGTWEEIERHKKEFVGRHLRVTVIPESSGQKAKAAPDKESAPGAQPKILTGFGAFNGKIGNSEEFAREKRIEIEREERRRYGRH